jgi:hypothetical protein
VTAPAIHAIRPEQPIRLCRRPGRRRGGEGAGLAGGPATPGVGYGTRYSAAADQAGAGAGLGGEITDHLGYDKHEVAAKTGANSRNGYQSKTVTNEVGPVEIEVSRDWEGIFEPQIVRKRQRRLNGVEEMVLSRRPRASPTGRSPRTWPGFFIEYGWDGLPIDDFARRSPGNINLRKGKRPDMWGHEYRSSRTRPCTPSSRSAATPGRRNSPWPGKAPVMTGTGARGALRTRSRGRPGRDW